MAREYFKCFHSYFEKTKSLTDAEVGRLFRALMQYSASGEAPSLAGRESIAFDFIADEIDRDKSAYAETCRKNAENGAKGGKRSVAVGSEREREEPKSSETDKVEGIRKDIKEIPTNVGTKKSRAFQPPTRDEVEAYCRERNNGIDPDAWMDYYQQRNWYLSKGVKMSDWKAAVRTWERHDFDRKPKKQNAALKYEQKPISKTDFDALVVNFEEEDNEKNE